MITTYFAFFVNLFNLISGSINEDKFIFPNLPLGIVSSANTLCTRENKIFFDNLDNSTLWAQQMWDASAKSTTGVLQGNVFHLGDYDECMKTEAPFETQFCLATVTAKVPVPTNIKDPFSLYHPPSESVLIKLHKSEDLSQLPRHTIHVGMCIPASCTRNDLANYLNNSLSNVKKNVTYAVTVAEKLCQSGGGRKNFDWADIGFCVVSATLVLLVVLSTAYDACTNKGDDFNSLLLSFSLKRSLHSLTHHDKSNSPLDVLHGVKVFAICTIITDHRLIFSAASRFINSDYFEEINRSWKSTYFIRGDLFVETFFVVGGILLSYRLLVQFDNKHINLGFIFGLRYIRLTPAYAYVVLLYATVLYHMDSGPLWELLVGSEVQYCRDNWWTNLLYINNYVNADQFCIIQSWYLPCDFHYFIIGIFVVLLIHKRKNIGFTLLVCLTIISLVIPFVVTIVNSYPAITPHPDSILQEVRLYPFFQSFYIKSHIKATPYFVGLFTGYIYYKWKDSSRTLAKITSHCMIVASTFLLLAPIIVGTVFYDPYYKYNSLETGTYTCLHRLSWAVGTAGIVFAASYGRCKILRNFLSWPGFFPLSRLVYGAYLMHTVFQRRDIGAIASPIRLSIFSLINVSLGDIVISFIAALFLYLMIESPVNRIAKILFFSSQKSSFKRNKIQM